jgi:hypothetical protein
MRDYRRSKPPWFKYNLSQWLLKMQGFHLNALISCDWTPGGRLEVEDYFVRMLGTAALCVEECGVITSGLGPPMERKVSPEDSDLDLVFTTIDAGCRAMPPGDLANYAVRISSCLHQAFTAMATPGGDYYALEAVRDIASLAVLGIENKSLGECDGKDV